MRCWKCKQPDVMMSPVVVKGRRRYLCGDCVYDNQQKESTVPTKDNDTTTDEGWEMAETNIGEPWDWKENPQFRGTFLENSSTTSSEGEEYGIIALALPDGKRCFAWASPEIRHAFRTIPPLSEVLIDHLGKADIGKGRTVNRFFVKFKSSGQPVPAAPVPAIAAQMQLGDEEPF